MKNIFWPFLALLRVLCALLLVLRRAAGGGKKLLGHFELAKPLYFWLKQELFLIQSAF